MRQVVINSPANPLSADHQSSFSFQKQNKGFRVSTPQLVYQKAPSLVETISANHHAKSSSSEYDQTVKDSGGVSAGYQTDSARPRVSSDHDSSDIYKKVLLKGFRATQKPREEGRTRKS